MIKRHRLKRLGLALVGFSILGYLTVANRTLPDVSASSKATVVFPEPPGKVAIIQQPQVAVLAGGCFWGVEGVFEHTKGVMDVVSGYAGSKAQDANYERVGTGQTGHAESVQIIYDPVQIAYGQLLKIYFSVVHDPTQLNQQGPDQGPQYRSTGRLVKLNYCQSHNPTQRGPAPLALPKTESMTYGNWPCPVGYTFAISITDRLSTLAARMAPSFVFQMPKP